MIAVRMKKTLPNAKKRAFLTAYAKRGTVLGAATATKIARRSHYEWLREDAEYAAAFETANEEFIEALEASVIESATNGIEEPVIYQGQLCFEPLRDAKGEIKRDAAGKPKYSKTPLTIRKRSDVAAFFMLKAKRPNVYREHSSVEVTGSLDIVTRLNAGRDRLAKLTEEPPAASVVGNG
jgi:hypothetical protein